MRVYARCCLRVSMRTRRHPRPPHAAVDANTYIRFLRVAGGLSILYTITELALCLYSVFGCCAVCSLFGFCLSCRRARCSNTWAHMQRCGQASCSWSTIVIASARGFVIVDSFVQFLCFCCSTVSYLCKRNGVHACIQSGQPCASVSAKEQLVKGNFAFPPLSVPTL